MTSSPTKISLPSARSAFRRPSAYQRRKNITPSPGLRRNLFGHSEGLDDLYRESTLSQQTAFQRRWNCRVDVLNRCCAKHGAASLRQRPQASAPYLNCSGPRAVGYDPTENCQSSRSSHLYQWIPINESSEELPCMLKRLALAQIRLDNIGNASSHPAHPHLCENRRPDSPIPFHSARISAPTSADCDVDKAEHDPCRRPSLFSLTLAKELTVTGNDEDQEIVAVSTPEADENKKDLLNLTGIPCLTPPSSPSKATETPQPRYMLRNKIQCPRQTKITDWYQVRKHQSHRKVHPSSKQSSSVRSLRPRLKSLGRDGVRLRPHQQRAAKNASRYSTEY